MYLDTLNLLIPNEPAPGCYGDSCAETSRWCILDGTRSLYPPLAQFFTSQGILRHPLSPWREEDTSQDQKLPLYLALKLQQNDALLASFKSFDKLWFLKDLIGIKTLAQALIFQIPWRWNDGTKSFERASASSADYLNFGIQLIYANLMNKENWLTRLAMKIVSKKIMVAKIKDYYGSNPTNNWYRLLWTANILKIW